MDQWLLWNTIQLYNKSTFYKMLTLKSQKENQYHHAIILSIKILDTCKVAMYIYKDVHGFIDSQQECFNDYLRERNKWRWLEKTMCKGDGQSKLHKKTVAANVETKMFYYRTPLSLRPPCLFLHPNDYLISSLSFPIVTIPYYSGKRWVMKWMDGCEGGNQYYRKQNEDYKKLSKDY